MGGPSQHGQRNKVKSLHVVVLLTCGRCWCVLVAAAAHTPLLLLLWQQQPPDESRAERMQPYPDSLLHTHTTQTPHHTTQAHKSGRRAGPSARDKHRQKKDGGGGPISSRASIKSAAHSSKLERAHASKQQRYGNSMHDC